MEDLQNIHERDIEKRANGSQVFTEPYSEAGMNRLKNLVVTFFSQGDRKYYSILVDGEIVVARNCDGRKFSKYLQFVNKDTKTVEVRMFQGFSPNCNKYQFVLSKGLTGVQQEINVQEQITKALEEQRLQTELQTLKEELDKKKRKLKKLKSENEQLQESSESGVDKLKGLIEGGVKLAGAFGFQPNRGLAGAQDDDSKPQPEAEVEVISEDEESAKETSHPKESENDQLYEDMVQAFGKEGMKDAFGWMHIIASNPGLKDLLTDELQRLKEEKDGEA